MSITISWEWCQDNEVLFAKHFLPYVSLFAYCTFQLFVWEIVCTKWTFLWNRFLLQCCARWICLDYMDSLFLQCHARWVCLLYYIVLWVSYQHVDLGYKRLQRAVRTNNSFKTCDRATHVFRSSHYIHISRIDLFHIYFTTSTCYCYIVCTAFSTC